MLNYPKVEAFHWLKQEKPNMVDAVMRWASINSHTFNLKGLDAFAALLKNDFKALSVKMETLPVDPVETIDEQGELMQQPLGNALMCSMRPDASFRALLVIHTDTVYPFEDGFIEPSLDGDSMYGPGVADAKGGIAVILWALRAFEQFKDDKGRPIGWTVLLNPDEEIGSPGSMRLLQSFAETHQVGLVFEPSLPDGSLVGERKGSGNFTLVVRGKAAHAGRAFDEGRNAIVGLSHCIRKLDTMNGQWPGVTVNVGQVSGGSALNVVPDLAIGRVNIRVGSKEEMALMTDQLNQLVEEMNSTTDLSLALYGHFFSPPKIMDAAHQALFDKVIQCGREMELPLNVCSTGGVCDGNKLSAFGLPTVDTLGVQGGAIHSHDEYCLCSSLPQRAFLTFSLLNRLNQEHNETEA